MSKAKTGVRIIAGQWRGRRLPVADSQGLRPSGDRLRETLFNWLQMEIRGSHCLDLFAGSGALGYEAASRGAASVIMLEQEQALASNLQQAKSMLKADNVTVINNDAMRWLADAKDKFDLVFIDPPWQSHLQQRCLELLISRELLNESALIYTEQPAKQPQANLTPGFTIHRQQQFGAALATLLQYQAD